MWSLMLLQCVLCFYLWVQFCGAVPQQRRELMKNTAPGCFHNNTMFADTSIIPSTEPCLRCKCSNKNLVCVRRVCKDQPYPPPRSCILVYKKSMCCPYLSCSKYHINFYKNSERNREHLNRLQVSHHYVDDNNEKTLEKSSRTDDSDEETTANGGCIESGSLYASGSAMVRSSSSLCSYCYCINGQQKCIKPKCELRNTKCKPIFTDVSCCPVKYDCSSNATSKVTSTHATGHQNRIESHKILFAKRKNRSNGCFESEKFYQEGEKLPSDVKRPCEMCYCIKGIRKCVIKKCAPTIRGCVPKITKEGNCCPTSYDCSRALSLKVTRQVRQNMEDDEADSIDFFSLLFGADEPVDDVVDGEEEEHAVTPSSTSIASATVKMNAIETTTMQPFKTLPTTEKSFFDLIRAGLEIIDANADDIDSSINNVVSTSKDVHFSQSTTAKSVVTNSQESTEKSIIESTATIKSQLSQKPISTTSSTKLQLPENVYSTPRISESTTLSSTMKKSSPTVKTPTISKNVISSSTIITATSPKPERLHSDEITTRPKVSSSSSVITTTRAPPTTTTRRATMKETTTANNKLRTTLKPSTTTVTMTMKTKMKTSTTTTAAVRRTSTEKPPRETTPKVLIHTTSGISTSTVRPKPTKFTTSTSTTRAKATTEKISTKATTMKSHQILEAIYGAGILPVSSFNENEENEAETLPNIEIIPFVAHDAIDTENYEPYLKPYMSSNINNNNNDNLEKDYFATDRAKPFRYNNKFIHHSYDDSADYGYTNPHERIDNSPYYFDTNDSQFDAFSPPSEQDFLGGFSPKESIYDEVPTIASHELPLKNNEFLQLPLDVPTFHEHKSNVTSTENTLTLPINQTSHKSSDDAKQHDMIPNFKKISSNFTGFIEDLLLGNVLEETSTKKLPTIPTTSTPTTTTASAAAAITKISTTLAASPSPALPSTSKVGESIINDDDFIIKHLKAPVVPMKAAQSPSRHEIFSKPTSPTMNGLLKLAGCNIYGQMYAVGHIIAELSSECLECKCLPDIGVGCSPRC